jgi:hypothetical protein
MISAEGSSKTDSTADIGVLELDEYCRICLIEPKSQGSWAEIAEEARLGLCILGTRFLYDGSIQMGMRYSLGILGV